MKSLRFRLNIKSTDLLEDIIKYVSEVRTKWIYDEEENFFSTNIKNLHMEVHELHVDFNILDEQKNVVKTKRICNRGKKNKPTPVALFACLQQRFAEEDDYKIYREIRKQLREGVLHQKRKNGIPFTENTDSGTAD